jgi:hypothetical protein
LVLAEAVVVGALSRSIQAISAYNDNPLVRVQDCMVSLSLVGGAKASNWARIANIAAHAAGTTAVAATLIANPNANANALELVWKQARVADTIKMVRVLARP